MSVTEESGFFSLAALAQQDVSEVSVIMSRIPAAGVYRVRCTGVAGKETAGKDGQPPLISFGYTHEILGANLVDKNKDPESLVGKKLSQRITIWAKTADDLLESIGLLKGNYQKVGLPHAGAMGGAEGLPPGWIDGAVNHEFDIRVRTYTKDGQENVVFDWLTPEQGKAAA